MADTPRRSHVSAPLMQVFRAAHQAQDAARKIDIRNEAGERIVAGRRLPARQVVTEAVLRQEVARDLDALLNSVAIESTLDLEAMPFVRKSILNFGLPDISHRTIDEIGIRKIPEEIKTAIVNFEPRLEGASLHIERDMSIDQTELRVRFIVRADLTCDPVHVPVEFTAEIIESGKVVVNRL
jgi:type VI secretion system protein ImpF